MVFALSRTCKNETEELELNEMIALRLCTATAQNPRPVPENGLRLVVHTLRECCMEAVLRVILRRWVEVRKKEPLLRLKAKNIAENRRQ